MALADGLEGLGKIQQQFTAIFNNVIDGAKKAFAAIKAGIGSTGIGLLVIALGSIVAYWDEIKYAIMGVSEGTKKAKAEQDVKYLEAKYPGIAKKFKLFEDRVKNTEPMKSINQKKSRLGKAN